MISTNFMKGPSQFADSTGLQVGGKHAMVKANRARRVIALAGDEKIRNLTLSEPARELVSI